MKTIYEAQDRQGRKWFLQRPDFVLGHDIFVGKQVRRPPRKARIVTRFTANVIGQRYGNPLARFYPESFRVEPGRKGV